MLYSIFNNLEHYCVSYDTKYILHFKFYRTHWFWNNHFITFSLKAEQSFKFKWFPLYSWLQVLTSISNNPRQHNKLSSNLFIWSFIGFSATDTSFRFNKNLFNKMPIWCSIWVEYHKIQWFTLNQDFCNKTNNLLFLSVCDLNTRKYNNF